MAAALSVDEAKRIILSYLNPDRLRDRARNTRGCRQVIDWSDLVRQHCRVDAVGRVSKRDVTALELAESQLVAEGVLGGRWNGYVTAAYGR